VPFMQRCGKLVLLACLGGLTGSYAIAPIAKLAQQWEIPTLAIVTLPFDFEGDARMEHAQSGKKSLEEAGVATAVFSNQTLMEIAGSKSMDGAFAVFDHEVLKLIEPMFVDGITGDVN